MRTSPPRCHAITSTRQSSSEVAHLRWRDLDLRQGILNVAASKTAVGVRQVVPDPELVRLLHEHKDAAEWTEPEDFVFAGRIREKPRERNSVRTRILYGAIEKANELLAASNLADSNDEAPAPTDPGRKRRQASLFDEPAA